MSSRMPPRYLPTLTEVVDPQALVAARASALAAALAPITHTPRAVPAAPALPTPAYSAAPVAAAPDKQALAQQLIKLVRPQLEAELRNLAQELFEAQFSALLPSMHLHIEEAVREAIEQALPESEDASH
jgi:hypothetical protein